MHAPQGVDWEAAVEYWKSLATDEDATFDREVVLRAEDIAPFVTWGTNPGQGIPLSEQEKVFDKFYRLDPNQVHGTSGTGLGLYISRELVRRMGGTLRLESTPGVGTPVTVELPAG